MTAITATPKTTMRKKPSNLSAVLMPSKKCRSAFPDFGVSTRSRK